MSTCLIITQRDKMFIGADSACSIKTNDGFRRYCDDMQKIFCIGEQVFFCSGNMNDVYECVEWIFNHFTHSICIEELKHYLLNKYAIQSDEYYNIEILIADYKFNTVYQLSQYNNFDIIVYPYSIQTRIICGGYKTSEAFILAKKNILMQNSIYDIYFNTYNDIVDECVGGYLYLYSSPVSFTKGKLIEHKLKYACSNKLHLLTSDFVTSGFVNGSQIIGGEIYSQNYGQDIGTMFDLNSGKFSLGGGKIKYDGDNLILKGVNLTWEDIDDAPTNISAFNNDAGYQNAIQVTQITKDTVTAPFIKTLNLTVGNEILMGDNATISWSQVTGTDNVALKSNIPTDEYITQITKNTVTTSYVNALNVTASSVAAENITGTTLKGKTIIVGGENNGDGSIIVKDSEGTIICTIGVNGIEVKSKSFVVTDGIDVIKGRYINSEYAPNLTELYGGLQCGAGTSTTSGTGYVGGYGHTRSEDKLTWGVNTGNIDVTNYQTLKLSVYVSIGGSTNLPWPYLRIYCDGVLVYIEDNNNFITSYTENYNTQIDSIDKLLEYDISSYSTIRVECCASADDDDDGWVTVGLTSLYLC